MPQLGSDKKPIIMNRKGKSTRILGLLGRQYSGSSMENYKNNYDRIFKKKPKLGEKNA
mgnify:FL=1|jgi:hypothetical protein|tara:strand:+ start:442 stop:615 length:174 start_codon:yes stop_codon:yes gene_type:complete